MACVSLFFFFLFFFFKSVNQLSILYLIILISNLFNPPFFLSSLDTNFSWANAGASVFGGTAKPKNTGEEVEGDEGDAADEVDIHFEPIVSLPEVPVLNLILNWITHLNSN